MKRQVAQRVFFALNFSISRGPPCTMPAESEVVCVPGQRLCLADEKTLTGQGTYEKSGYIYAMLAGYVEIRDEDKVCSDRIQ